MFKAFADWFVGQILGLDLSTPVGHAIHFFVWDVPKILVLLSIMIFIISYIRSYFSPEQTKKKLERFSGFIGNIIASGLGVLTPFCSCSSVPIFIGFVEAGVPLGVTFSFLITSPIVNEFAVGMLIIMFGWRVAATYVAAGMLIGIFGGLIIGKLNMLKYVESYVFEISIGDSDVVEEKTWHDRYEFAKDNVVDIFKSVWIYVVIGIAVGAFIHGWVPASFLETYAGPQNPFAVLVGVIAGIPLYSNAMGALPIAEALIAKGVGVGTALSFIMAVTALSLPQMIILRRVIKTKLIVVFVGITGVSIVFVGYLMNFLFA